MRTIELRNGIEIIHTEEIADDRVANAVRRYRAEADRLNRTEGVDTYKYVIIPVPTEMQKLVDGELVAKTLAELVADKIITQAEADERAASDVREKRDGLLFQSDWMVLPDNPHDTTAVRDYRQKLRDITEQKGFPHTVEWPVL